MTDLGNTGQTAGNGADPVEGAATGAGRKSSAKTSKPQQDAMTDDSNTTLAGGQSPSSASADESRLRQTLQQIEARAEELRRWGMERQEMAREVVEERPLAVVGAAFGVGLLLGLVASRL